jgi:hypothetical protein
MYSHGQASIALCEAYALTRDSRLREPAQAALDFIVSSQHPGGGWRYFPGEAGDTSVVGWQIMALRSGQLSGLKVPPKTLHLAGNFLDSVQQDNTGGLYSYQPGGSPTPTMTAEALLCRQYSGWPQRHPGLVSGVQSLLTQHLPTRSDSNMYYWYYATQVMHHMGGRAWDEWNYHMRDLLVDTQQTSGHQAGSWSPSGGHDTSGGRVYMTALAICTLEVYYRHLPIYSAEATDERAAKSPKTRKPKKSVLD